MSEPMCRNCRHSAAKQAQDGSVALWCLLRKDACEHPCPGYEREPGTEGDDD